MKNTAVRRMMVRAVSMMMLGGMLSGCLTEEDELQLDDVATSKQAEVYGNVRTDAYLVWQYPYNTYKDIGVSSTQFYLLKNDGTTEIRNNNAPGSLVASSATNFSAIDYVDDTWALVAARDAQKKFFLKVFSPSGENFISIPYPTGDLEISEVVDIAAIPNPQSPSSKIWIFLRDQRIIWGEYTINEGMTWKGKVIGAYYIHGLFGRKFGNTEYLMFYTGYQLGAMQRIVAPNGTLSTEVLGTDPSGVPYDGHAYWVPAPQLAYDQFQAPYGMDYSPARGMYYALDRCKNGGVEGECLVRIADGDIDF